MEQITEISLSAVVLGLNGIVGQLGVPKKMLPICSVVVGVAMQFIVSPSESVGSKILTGIILGLTATGIYSGTKNTKQYFDGKNE